MKAKVVSSLVAAGWLAACSTPARSPGEATSAKPARDLQLIEGPAGQAQSISDLEAGRRLRIPERRPVERTLADQPVPAPVAEPTPVEAALTPSGVEPTLEPAGGPSASTAPESPAVTEDVVEIKDRGLPMSFQAPGADYPAMDGSEGLARRGPTILIRGGRGGIDDSCDPGRPGAHGNHGVAINRVSPSTPGGLRSSGPSRVGGRLGAGIR
jgi:hypothetical protein